MRGLSKTLGALFAASVLTAPAWAANTSIEVNNAFKTPTTLSYAAKTTYKLSEFNSLGNVVTSGDPRYRGYIIVPAKIISTDGTLSVSVTYTSGNWAGYFFGAKVYSTDMELLASSEISNLMENGSTAGGNKQPVTYSFTDTSKLTTDKEVLIFILGGLEAGKTPTVDDAKNSTGKIDLTGASPLNISGSVSYIPGSSTTLSISSTPTTWTDYYFPVKVNSDATTVNMKYAYSSGTQRVDISRVDAISLSTAVPQVVASDVHNGSTGNTHSNNTYELTGLTSGSTVVLRMRAKSPGSGTHTGSITALTGATALGAISDIAPWSTTVTPVYSAAAGDTLTVTGTITGDVPVTVGAEGQTGTVTFAAGTLANYTGTISLGNATLTFADLMERPAIQVTNNAAIIDLTSVESLLTGKIPLARITFADGVTQCTVKGGDATATVTATELAAGSVSVTADPTYDGNRWWWDYEFNGNGDNLGFEGTGLSWDSDRPFKDSEYTTADENRNQMLHLPARPWRNVDSGYPESFTAVMYCKAGSAGNSILAAFGSAYKNGTEAIVLMTGANPAAGQMSLVLCHAKASFDTLVDQEKMTIPNVSSSYHLYAFTCRTVEGKTVVDIYVDGDLVTSYKADSLITLGQGFQLASEHGGSPNGVNRLEDADEATLDFLRVSNVALSSDAIKALAEAYPYTSRNGRATRTVTASDTTWSEGTTWAQASLQSDGTTATVNQAAPTAETVVEVTASEAATLAMNLADAVTYENLVVKGEGSLVVTKAADTTATVTVTGATTISANTTLPANVVKVGRVSVDEGKTLTFDCSTLDGLQSSYTLTGYVEEAVASRIRVANVPASALYSDYTLSRDNTTGSMELTASTLKPIAATISGETSWADVLWTWEGNTTGSTLAAIPAEANVTLTLSADSTLTLPASAITVADLTISGTGTLAFAESGATVTVTNTLTANTDVDASNGKLILASTVTDVAIADTKTLKYKTTAGTTLPPMSGTNGTFSVNCAATTKLSHTVDYLSAIVVSGGTLDFTAENYTKPFKMTVQNGAMARTDWAGALTSTAASLRLEGGATFFMRNGNTTNGNSQIVTPITIAATNELPAVIKGSHNGNYLHLTGPISGTGTLKFAGFNNHFTVDGVISDGSNEGDVLAVVLDSIVSGENSAANVIFTAANTYTGGTTIKNGANLTLNKSATFGSAEADRSFANGHNVALESGATLTLAAGAGFYNVTGSGKVSVAGDYYFGFGDKGGKLEADTLEVATTAHLYTRGFKDYTPADNKVVQLKTLTVSGEIARNAGDDVISLSVETKVSGTGKIGVPLTLAANATLDVTDGALTAGTVTCNGTVTVTGAAAAADTVILTCSSPATVAEKLTGAPAGYKFAATETAVVLAKAGNYTVGDKTFESLEKALAAIAETSFHSGTIVIDAGAPDEITLTKQILLDDATAYIGIDLGGKTLKVDSASTDEERFSKTPTESGATSSGAIWVRQGSLTLYNGTIETTGRVLTVGAYNTSGKKGLNDDTAELLLPVVADKTVATLKSTGEFGVVAFEGAHIITSGNISTTAADCCAISGNGLKYNTAHITIEGGTITSEQDIAIYNPQYGSLTITGGTITGKTAVYVKGGDFSVGDGAQEAQTTISGGTLIGKGGKVAYKPNGNGAYATGDALVIDNDNRYAPLTVTITGGQFSSVNAEPIASYSNVSTDVRTGFVSGGKFDKAIAGSLCADGKCCVKTSGDSTYPWTIGTLPAISGGESGEVVIDTPEAKDVIGEVIAAASASGDTPTAVEVLPGKKSGADLPPTEVASALAIFGSSATTTTVTETGTLKITVSYDFGIDSMTQTAEGIVITAKVQKPNGDDAAFAEGVTVKLVDEAGNEIATATPAADGTATFPAKPATDLVGKKLKVKATK